MNRYTHLEDLSNEIFFELFDYLDAFNIFQSFDSLNRRITSILQKIPIRVVVLHNHRRYQIDYLSSCLTSHAHQVISMDIFDTIDDDSSIISLLFSQHQFINLQSCTFISIHPSTQLENVIKQIKSFNKLVSFCILYPKRVNLTENVKKNLLETVFMHKSLYLRSIDLQLPYYDSHLSKYRSIPSHLKSLSLHISGSTLHLCTFSIISIFRFCHSIEYLSILLSWFLLTENNNISNGTESENDENLPTLLQMKSFNLSILGYCDSRSIYYVLHCMPKLRCFYFTLTSTNVNTSVSDELVDGSVWKRILDHNVPCLSKFEFDMLIETKTLGLSSRMIVNSFIYCVRKYSNWHMVINRWKSSTQTDGQNVLLRTLNYDKRIPTSIIEIPVITSQSFETLSTTIDDYHLFYRYVYQLNICITKKRPTITWSSPLFRHIVYLNVEISSCSSIWNSLSNIISVNETSDDGSQDSVTCLSQFVYLPNVSRVEFGSTFDGSHWRDIQLILQACPNVTQLVFDTRLLLLPKLIDNLSLISFFRQVKTLILKKKNISFSSNLSLKIVQRFPSLNRIELQIFSFDHCVPVIDVFISHLKQLSYIKIHYFQDTLLDDPFSVDYILTKRSKIFRDVHLNAEVIKVKNNGEVIQIWLS